MAAVERGQSQQGGRECRGLQVAACRVVGEEMPDDVSARLAKVSQHARASLRATWCFGFCRTIDTVGCQPDSVRLSFAGGQLHAAASSASMTWSVSASSEAAAHSRRASNSASLGHSQQRRRDEHHGHRGGIAGLRKGSARGDIKPAGRVCQDPPKNPSSHQNSKLRTTALSATSKCRVWLRLIEAGVWTGLFPVSRNITQPAPPVFSRPPVSLRPN